MTSQFFVGIGAQKAGTSWLANYFSTHPEVAFSPIKELHYFDTVYRNDLCNSFEKIFKKRLKVLLFEKKINTVVANVFKSTNDILASQTEMIRCLSVRLEMKNNPKRYHDYFDALLEPQHKAYGEITPSYSLLNANGFDAIKNIYKSAKFIFCLRDPVDRYWSHLRFVETKSGKAKFNSKQKIFDCLDMPQFKLRTDYKRTLTELYKVVPKEDVCIIFYENLTGGDSHPAELKKVTNFLNIDYIEGNITKKTNVSNYAPLEENQVKRIAIEFSYIYEYIENTMPGLLPDRWKQRMLLIK